MEFTLANLTKLPRFVVAISPQRYDPDRLTPEQCIEVVSTSQVRARGWYFPHIDSDGTSVGPKRSYVLHETEALGYHLEQWRMYRSAQFVFRMMPWEVPDEKIQSAMRSNAQRWDSRRNVDNIPGFFSFVMLILSIAEAYLFAAQLAQAARFDTAVDLKIGLRDVRGWALGSNDPGVTLHSIYAAKNGVVEHDESLSLHGLIADPLAAAVSATEAVFQQFGWLKIAPQTISNWQRQYIK